MKKETLYIWVIVGLILVNAMQLGAFLCRPKPPKPLKNQQHHDFRIKAVGVLNLNPEQKKQFNELADQHRAKMKELNEQQKLLTATYFNKPTESGLEAIQEIQSQRIEVTQSHFNEIKELLNPQQMPNYEAFKKEALQRILR